MSHDEIRLALPASPPFARLARLTVAGLASRGGYSYDEVEDLRIAMGEAWSLLIGPGAVGESVEVTFDLGPEAMVIDLEGRPSHDPRLLAEDDLSHMILEAVVDQFEVGRSSVRLLKRRAAGRA